MDDGTITLVRLLVFVFFLLLMSDFFLDRPHMEVDRKEWMSEPLGKPLSHNQCPYSINSENSYTYFQP